MTDSMGDFLRQDVQNGEFVGVAIAIALIVALRLLLPDGSRRLLRQPVLLLGLHLVAQTMVRLLPQEGTAHRALVVVAVLLLLGSIARGSVLLVLDVALGRRMERPLPKIIRDLTQGVVYLLIGMASLRAAGIDPGSLLTTSALITAVIGLSLQDTLGNLFAGLAIQMQRPFEVGDWIQFDGEKTHIGKVLEINWRGTKVVTLDDVEIVIPNGTLGKAPITNFTKPTASSRRSLYVVLPYSVPPKRAQKLIFDALADSFGVLPSPKPSIVTNQFTEAGIEYWIRIWTDEFGKRDSVDGQARDRIWYALSREGIQLAFPNRSIFMHEVTEESRARDAKARAASRIASLKGVDFLAVLPEGELERVADAARSCLYAAGEIVVRKGDRSSDLFIIHVGAAKVMVPTKKKGELEEIARLEEGKFFGEMALMTGEPRNATVVAAEDSQLFAIDREAFQSTLEAHPQLAETISRVLAERQAKLEKYQSDHANDQEKNLEERTSQILSRIKSFFAI